MDKEMEEETPTRILRLPSLSTQVRCSLASRSTVSRFPRLVSTFFGREG